MSETIIIAAAVAIFLFCILIIAAWKNKRLKQLREKELIKASYKYLKQLDDEKKLLALNAGSKTKYNENLRRKPFGNVGHIVIDMNAEIQELVKEYKNAIFWIKENAMHGKSCEVWRAEIFPCSCRRTEIRDKAEARFGIIKEYEE